MCGVGEREREEEDDAVKKRGERGGRKELRNEIMMVWVESG
jgi:hypothetical protein